MGGRHARVSVRVRVPRGEAEQGRARCGISDCLPGWKAAREGDCAHDRVWSQPWRHLTTWAMCWTFLEARGKGVLLPCDHWEA